MAIVGYIADVTDFGRKGFAKKVKKAKEEPKKEVVEEVTEAVADEAHDTTENVENTVDEVSDIIGTPDASEEVTELQETATNDLFADAPATNEIPEANIETNFANEINDEVANVDQSLFEPLPSIDDNTEETTEEVAEVETTDNAEKSENDVWNF